jgi:hypothetical protein
MLALKPKYDLGHGEPEKSAGLMMLMVLWAIDGVVCVIERT